MTIVPRGCALLRAVLFDVDGTLVDSVDLHAHAWKEAFAHYGKTIPFGKVRSQIGKGGDQLIPYFLDQEEQERWAEELHDFRKKLFQERYLSRVKPFPMVRELLERIRADGKRVIVASSSPEAEVKHYLRLLQIEDQVDGFTSADDVDRSKPHPDIFEAALERAGVESATEALVVGDSPFDAEAASHLALPTVGVRCGGFPDEELRQAGVIALYDSPADLLVHYDSSPLARDSGGALGPSSAYPPQGL